MRVVYDDLPLMLHEENEKNLMIQEAVDNLHDKQRDGEEHNTEEKYKALINTKFLNPDI